MNEEIWDDKKILEYLQTKLKLLKEEVTHKRTELGYLVQQIDNFEMMIFEIERHVKGDE